MTPLRSSARVSLAVTAAVAVALTSCAGEEKRDSDDRTAFVYTMRANQPVFSLDVPDLSRILAEAVEGGGELSVVTADGVPSVVAAVDLSLDEVNDRMVQRAEERIATDVSAAFGSAVADDPEADPLGALGRAADAVRGATGNQTIVVVDSGVQTTGALSLQAPGLLQADPVIVTQYLADAKAIPDLSGIEVHWYGMGETSASQSPLDTAARARLTDLWTAVIAEAGGELRLISTPGVAADYDPGALPFVTPVTFDAVEAPSGLSVALTDTQVAFVADSAAFLSPAEADVALAALAETIVAGGLRNVSVTGTTASTGNPDGEHSLSLARATAVADRLVELGVPAEWLVTVEGVGASFPGYVDNYDAAGHFVEELARANRLVMVAASAT